MFKDVIKAAVVALEDNPELPVSDTLREEELEAAIVLLNELFKVMEATSR